MANIARPTKIWDQTLNDWVYLAGVVDTTKSYTYTADQTFPGITASSINGGSIAGKNYIINGNFDIWQRGTSFSMANGFGPDRYVFDGHGTTLSISRSTDVPNANSKYSLQVGMTSYNSSDLLFRHHIERPTNLYGQLTISFWAKVASGTVKINADVNDNATSDFTVTTSWQKFSGTIGNSTTVWDLQYPVNLYTFLDISIATSSIPYTGTLYLSQIKLEAGTQATQFCTAGANIQQELAMCQRYYARLGGDSAYGVIGTGIMGSTTEASFVVPLPVPMRVAPLSIDFSTLRVTDFIGVNTPISSMSLTTSETTKFSARLYSSGLSGLTQYRPAFISNYNSSNGYLGFYAEM